MSDRTLRLLLIDQDTVFRTGLRVVIEQFPDLQVAESVETGAAALQILAELSANATASTTNIASPAVDLVILSLCLSRSRQMVGLQLCRQLKTQYPNLPVLLLSSLQEPTQLAAARATGVDGYCPKGIPVSQLVAAIRQVAAGRSYWVEPPGEEVALGTRQEGGLSVVNTNFGTNQESSLLPPRELLATIRNHLRLSGLRQINTTLAEVTAQLRNPGLPLLDQAILAGQRRELLAARWLVNQLLAAPEGTSQKSGVRSQKLGVVGAGDMLVSEQTGLSNPPVQESGVRDHPFELPPSSNPSPQRAIAPLETSSPVSFRTLQADLFESTLAKLQFSLQNLTDVPLEIDIFREEKKRELLYLILRKIEDVLDELRFSQVDIIQLSQMHSVIVGDLWQAATIDFFGKYSTLRVVDASGKGETLRQLEIVNFLLQDAVVVQTAILNKIPLVLELFDYLLFQTPLIIDNAPYPAGSPKAMKRAEALLQNLLIHLANGVVQPLLNRLADVEAIKQSFYDQRLISTREIERFRNNLSWKYRVVNYVGEPKAIFESRYELFVLVSRGIAKISIYAPRSQELAQLSGIRLVVTLALETRDAIAPRLRAAVAFLGRGVVYILTQVVGRAIGLVGRGILQGIGGSLPESKFGRNKERPK